MIYTISLTGDLGSGKTTVRDIFAKNYGTTTFTTGELVREAGRKRGMDINEFSLFMEKHPETDREIDDALAAMNVEGRSIIIDSRMAWHFVRGTFRVYLSVDPLESARRILKAGRGSEHFESLEEAAANVTRRKKSERDRYLALYGIDRDRLHNYDLVLDTTCLSPEKTAEIIAEEYNKYVSGLPRERFYLCPKRIIAGCADEDGDIVVSRDGDSFTLVKGARSLREKIDEEIVACAVIE